MDQVVARNDQAASLMLAGRNEEANTLLLQCLDMVKSNFLHDNQFDPPPTVSDPATRPSEEEGEPRNIEEDSSIGGLSRTDSFVYSRPLFYRHINRAYNFQTHAKSFVGVMISATIVFNLALLHHSIGNQTGSDTAFSKARQLYTMTIGLVSTNAKWKVFGFPSEIRVLASNNLCHLLFLQRSSRSSAGSEDDAQRLATSIQSQMSEMRQTNDIFLMRSVWDDVLINVFSWQNFKGTISAACAA